jgi:hypothetical protein
LYIHLILYVMEDGPGRWAHREARLGNGSRGRARQLVAHGGRPTSTPPILPAGETPGSVAEERIDTQPEAAFILGGQVFAHTGFEQMPEEVIVDALVESILQFRSATLRAAVFWTGPESKAEQLSISLSLHRAIAKMHEQLSPGRLAEAQARLGASMVAIGHTGRFSN